MSRLTVEDVKRAISITHSDDDALLLRLIDSAARECAKCVYGSVPDYTVSGAVPDPLTVPEYATGMILVIRGDYEGDPIDRPKYVEAAKGLWLAESGWVI